MPALVTSSSRPGLKVSLLEVEQGLPSVSSTVKHDCSPSWCIWNSPFFFSNPRMSPGWFTPLLHPSSLHPSSPPCVFAFLVQFPFLSPRGVESSIRDHWGSCACSGSCVFLVGALMEAGCCLAYRWASVKGAFTAGHPGCFWSHLCHWFGARQSTNKDLNGAPFILTIRVDGVNLSLSGWVLQQLVKNGEESICFTADTTQTVSFTCFNVKHDKLSE